jgi:hypothetical protein
MSNPNFKPRNKSALCDRETLIKTLSPFHPQGSKLTGIAPSWTLEAQKVVGSKPSGVQVKLLMVLCQRGGYQRLDRLVRLVVVLQK